MATLPAQEIPSAFNGGARPSEARRKRGFVSGAVITLQNFLFLISSTRTWFSFFKSYHNEYASLRTITIPGVPNGDYTFDNDPNYNGIYYFYRGLTVSSSLVAGKKSKLVAVRAYWDSVYNQTIKVTLLTCTYNLGSPQTDWSTLLSAEGDNGVSGLQTVEATGDVDLDGYTNYTLYSRVIGTRNSGDKFYGWEVDYYAIGAE